MRARGPTPAGEPSGDAALIERSRRHPEAFAGLYDRHAPAMHRYVARRLGDGAADGVVADTFLDAFRRRHAYDLAISDARPWLYGIAANLIGKHSRAEVRMLRAYARTGTDPVLTVGAVSGHAEEADSRLSAQAAARQLADAIASLAQADREVLLLIAWADLSYNLAADPGHAGEHPAFAVGEWNRFAGRIPLPGVDHAGRDQFQGAEDA
jgi:RNA polymerase sigma factor (sigma-70 family)